MSSSRQKLFITGGTGDIGLKTIKRFEQFRGNVDLRILCRRQDQADNFERRGFEAVIGNLDESVEELSHHMTGCHTLLLISPGIKNQEQQCLRAIDAAIEAGISFVIKISAADARHDVDVPWAKAHAVADDYLINKAQQHDIKYVVLRTSAFMQNLLTEAAPISKGFLPQACGSGKAGWIDTEDIAEVCYRITLDGVEKHQNKTYILTGPALISMYDISAALSKSIGHRVHYIDLPGPVFGALLRFSGTDPWMADGLVKQFVDVVKPNKEGIDATDHVEKITGRKPISIEQFATRNRTAFEGTDILPYLQYGGAAVMSACLIAYLYPV